MTSYTLSTNYIIIKGTAFGYKAPTPEDQTSIIADTTLAGIGTSSGTFIIIISCIFAGIIITTDVRATGTYKYINAMIAGSVSLNGNVFRAFLNMDAGASIVSNRIGSYINVFSRNINAVPCICRCLEAFYRPVISLYPDPLPISIYQV